MSPTSAIKALSAEWQAALALAGALVVGATVAGIMSGYMAIPKQVHENTLTISANRDAIVITNRRVDSIKADVARIRCVVEANALRRDPVERCGL